MIGWYFKRKNSDLEEEFLFFEDNSEFLLFPELDEQLPSSESIVDYADVEEDRGEIQEIALQNIDSVNDETKKRKRETSDNT